jgi:glycosyltransferase involved in cell wall biosynthesis
MKHVLYVSYDGMTDPLGQSQVLPYLAGLSKEGYRFTLISFEKPDRYEAIREHIAALCKVSNIDWHPLMYTKRPPVLSTIWDVMRMQREAVKIYERDPYQIIHARSYIAAIVGRAMQKKYSIKHVFDMRGFWADERVDGKIWRLSNPLYRGIYKYFKAKEKQFLETADHIVTLTYTAEKEIHSWTKLRNNPVPITVIPCCVDMDKFAKGKVDDTALSVLRAELGISPDEYVLSYLGSLGTWYLLGEMLDFYQVLVATRPHARLLIVTNDPQEAIVPALQARGIAISQVTIVRAPFERVPYYISLSHASIFFIKQAYSKKGSSPIKQGELMSMGVPVVCNAQVGDTDWIVNKYQSGIVVAGFDTGSYQQAVQALLRTTFDTDKTIAGATDYFSLAKGVASYLAVYNKLIDG